MSSTDKVLGTIGAINTFIENFPMSLLDMMHGKVYTSIFEFIIDVLAACGVDVNEIINRLQIKYDSVGNVAKLSNYAVSQKFGTTVNELTSQTEFVFEY
jgi:hypothetical protein